MTTTPSYLNPDPPAPLWQRILGYAIFVVWIIFVVVVLAVHEPDGVIGVIGPDGDPNVAADIAAAR